jgi:SWI/SNF-related matrix-associated actin-dependent regulator 1 of chromatin subfamily A
MNQRDPSVISERRDADVFWPEGLTPLPHQLDAVKFALNRLEASKPSYLALDPGLGKTIVATLIANLTKTDIFYVCPPFLSANTNREFTKWCFLKRLYLLPDSMIARKKAFEEFKFDFWDSGSAGILIVDEAHRFKNFKSKRTKALLNKIMPHFQGRVIFMSGTPMPNSRPLELWPVLRAAVPELFGKPFFPFALKYCGAFQHEFGWDFTGFSNRKEFRARVTKSFMLRMKKEILNLPPKREGLLVVGDDRPPAEIARLEKKILNRYKEDDIVSGDIKEFFGIEGEIHLATYLRLLGSYKLKHVLPFIESVLEDTQENILVFAVHKEVIATLAKALQRFKPLVITGDVPKNKRQEIVNTFQESKEHKLFIGNIQACGVGFTLTKATRVLFVEFSWVDGENTQSADRAHRIGQKDSVLVQYIVLNGSIDHKRMEVLLRKRSLAI